MNEVFLIAGDYLKGKSIYKPARRILNLLFNISIASFIYEKIYGNYNWLNYNDYKGLLNFFIKGEFFIPFSIFIAVYGLTQFSSIIIFYSGNHFKTVKWTRSIIYYKVKKDAVEERLKEINEASKIVSPIRITKSLLINLYEHLRKEMTPEFYENIEKELKEPKNNLEETFHLVFRMFITITVYYISLTQFGFLLYILTSLILFITMYLVMIAYRFLDIIPTLFSKFQKEAENYILEHQNIKQ